MVLEGYAKLAGVRSGKTKNNVDWASVVLDAQDNSLERVEYFVPDVLMHKVSQLLPGDVKVRVRLYPGKDRSFGSRLLDIDACEKAK